MRHEAPGILGRLLRWNWHRLMRNEAEVTTAVAPSTLTAEDRCDRCGAQAYLRVELQTGGELLFCAHHAREHGEALKEIAVNLHDETHKLQTPRRSHPTTSPDQTTRPSSTAPDPGPGPSCIPQPEA